MLMRARFGLCANDGNSQLDVTRLMTAPRTST
jgi:hypothetical protein